MRKIILCLCLCLVALQIKNWRSLPDVTQPKTRGGGGRNSMTPKLTAENVELIESSGEYILDLFRRAAEHDARNDTVYGKVSTPYISFLITKTGSNTQQRYHLEALASVGAYSNAGCAPPDRYLCLTNKTRTVGRTSCEVGFSNHFRPHILLDTLVAIDRHPDAKCQRWPDLTAAGAFPSPKDLLRRSVCSIVLRDPVDRAISAFYEFHYRRNSTLNAFEFLLERGAQRFVKLFGKAQYEWTTPKVWLDVFESCVVGVTDRMDSYLYALSRVARFSKAPSKAVRLRSRERVGVKDKETQEFYRQLTPYLEDDIALYELAAKIAEKQYQVALTFDAIAPNQLMANNDLSCKYFSHYYGKTSNSHEMEKRWISFESSDGSEVGYRAEEPVNGKQRPCPW